MKHAQQTNEGVDDEAPEEVIDAASDEEPALAAIVTHPLFTQPFAQGFFGSYRLAAIECASRHDDKHSVEELDTFRPQDLLQSKFWHCVAGRLVPEDVAQWGDCRNSDEACHSFWARRVSAKLRDASRTDRSRLYPLDEREQGIIQECRNNLDCIAERACPQMHVFTSCVADRNVERCEKEGTELAFCWGTFCGRWLALGKEE